jgi:hypothetical protein
MQTDKEQQENKQQLNCEFEQNSHLAHCDARSGRNELQKKQTGKNKPSTRWLQTNKQRNQTKHARRRALRPCHKEKPLMQTVRADARSGYKQQ